MSINEDYLRIAPTGYLMPPTKWSNMQILDNIPSMLTCCKCKQEFIGLLSRSPNPHSHKCAMIGIYYAH